MTNVDKNGVETPGYEVTCQWDETWTSDKIPGICECEYTEYDPVFCDSQVVELQQSSEFFWKTSFISSKLNDQNELKIKLKIHIHD